MSRPYKITTRPGVNSVAVANDHVKGKIEMPVVLPPEQNRPILQGILKEHGFDDGGDGTMSREQDGVTVEVDPNGGVTISTSETEGLPPQIDDEGGGGCTCATRLRQMAREAERDGIARGLQDRVTKRLERALPALGCELEKVGNQILGKALVQKARSLGEIKSIHHDNQSGGMTIVVEV